MSLARDIPSGAAVSRTLGIVTSLLFFASVLFHELSHSVVARHYKIPVASITLFFFGGIASITWDPESAGQEFLIAAAGPASSYVLAGGFWLLSLMTPDGSMLNALGGWLAGTNLLLATFNLLPGFPLDWRTHLPVHHLGNYQGLFPLHAHCGADRTGDRRRDDGFRPFLAFRLHSSVNGVWFIFLAGPLLSAARQSYAQITTQGALQGLRAIDVMTSEMPTIGRDLTL